MIWLSVIAIFSFYTIGIDGALKPIEPLQRPVWLLAKTKLEISCTQSDSSLHPAWYKDGTKVVNTPPRVTYDMNDVGAQIVSTLTVGDLTVDDAGVYSCQTTDGDKQEVEVKILQVNVVDATYKALNNATIGAQVINLSDKQQKDEITSIVWLKNGTDKMIPDGSAIVWDEKNNTLTLARPSRKDIGKYVCEFTFSVKIDGKETHIQLLQPAYINDPQDSPHPPGSRTAMWTSAPESQSRFCLAVPKIKVNYKSKNLVEGDILMLECEASGYPTPAISWFKEGELLTAGNRTAIKDLSKEDKYGSIFVADGLLVIDDLTFDDRADYMCEASNVLGSYNYTITLRVKDDPTFDDRADYMCEASNDFWSYNYTITLCVKDKLAALWPFMAIVCEVVILCIIIFIYEKKKGKELDQAAAHLNGKHEIPRDKKPSKEDVRLRKS